MRQCAERERPWESGAKGGRAGLGLGRAGLGKGGGRAWLKGAKYIKIIFLAEPTRAVAPIRLGLVPSLSTIPLIL